MSLTTVPEFFERLSDGSLYTSSDLRKLWTNLYKGSKAAATQFLQCLLIHVQAPEKYGGDKSVPAFIQELIHNMPLDRQGEKTWAEEFVTWLLQQLIEWLPHKAKHSRVRVMHLLIAILRGMPQGAELDGSGAEVAIECLRCHLNDKDDTVRELSAVALTKLASFEMGCIRSNPVYEELVGALCCDVSQDVRVAIVRRLPLDGTTLDSVLRHHTDRSVKVAGAVFDRVAQDVALTPTSQPSRRIAASQEQRSTLLWVGLQEPRPDVRKAAQGLLVKWFTEDAAGDVVALLAAFGPQENASLCNLLLEELDGMQKWEPQAWLHALDASGRSPRALMAATQAAAVQLDAHAQQDSGLDVMRADWVSAISPEMAFACVHACVKVERLAAGKGRAAAGKMAVVVAQAEASAGAQAEAVLEAFLPNGVQMAKMCLVAAQAGPPHRYVTGKLLELAALPCMNWVDACSREAAEQVLCSLITRVTRPEEYQPTLASPTNTRGSLLPAGCGGSGAWEGAVLRFAVAVFGEGLALVSVVLPLVLKLAEELSITEERLEEAPEGALLQVLTYLHLLLVMAGPGVRPTAHVVLKSHTGAPAAKMTLAQAVDQFAWTSSGHPSPTVRAAAVRCRVVICLRDGGREQVPKTIAMLGPLLPSHACPSASDASSNHNAHTPEDAECFARQQLPRRGALHGLIDLTLMWGEPVVTSELAAAAAAVARARSVEALRAQMEGLDVDSNAAGAAGGLGDQQPAAALATRGVVDILLRLTEGVVRRLQGYDTYVMARGCVSDALLGMTRLLLAWPLQRRLEQRVRHQVVTTMKAHQAEQMLTRLLLARFSPTVEAEVGPRSQLTTFFKSFQAAACSSCEGGALYRRTLAGAFLAAARCAMALPAPACAPPTARGCAAPALMEFAAEVLAAAASAANQKATALDNEVDDVPSQSGTSAEEAAFPSLDACTWLCELVLEEVVRLAAPGSASLDLGEPRVMTYTTELCKTPLRLLPGLPLTASSQGALRTSRRLAYLGRRAVQAGRALKGTVPVTACQKLEDFVNQMEELQRGKTAPLSDQDAAPVVQALLAQLRSLPSQDAVNASTEVDVDWDVVSPRGADQAGDRRRAGAGRGKATTSSGGQGTRGRRRVAAKAPSNRTTSHKRSGDTRPAQADADDESDDRDEADAQGRSYSDEEEEWQPAACRCASSASQASASTATGAGARRTAVAPAAREGPRPASPSQSQVMASQGERRSSRAAAAKAAIRLQSMRG